jgi:hypothetical protein
MTTTFWFTVGQTVVFLAVCGFAVWAARLIAEAADNSTLAVEQAVKAARDAERTAAEVREMRDMLRTWIDQQQAEVGLYRQHQTPDAPVPTGRVGTDTAEAQAVLTPQAIIARDDNVDLVKDLPGEAPGPHRGRHARHTGSPWTAALRLASRTSRDK